VGEDPKSVPMAEPEEETEVAAESLPDEWTITVLRGRSAETRSFPLPDLPDAGTLEPSGYAAEMQDTADVVVSHETADFGTEPQPGDPGTAQATSDIAALHETSDDGSVTEPADPGQPQEIPDPGASHGAWIPGPRATEPAPYTTGSSTPGFESEQAKGDGDPFGRRPVVAARSDSTPPSDIQSSMDGSQVRTIDNGLCGNGAIDPDEDRRTCPRDVSCPPLKQCVEGAWLVPQDNNVVVPGDIDGNKDAVSLRINFNRRLGVYPCRETPAHAQSDFVRHGQCTPGGVCIASVRSVSTVRRESSRRAMPESWAACPVCSADKVGARPAGNAKDGGSGSDTGKAVETDEDARGGPAL
jgi:hypothetical protein